MANELGIEFYSLSKSCNMTSVRISFALGNAAVSRQFKEVRSQNNYGIFLPVWKAAISALTGSQEAVKEQYKEYEHRSKALCGGLR